jgi:hypothetical protein
VKAAAAYSVPVGPYVSACSSGAPEGKKAGGPKPEPRRTRSVPPAAGKIDGTYATWPNGTGFVFLFNPNAAAAFTPDGVLAMTAPALGLVLWKVFYRKPGMPRRPHPADVE